MKTQDQPRPAQRLLRTREVAAILGISVSFAKNLVKDGTLRSVRINTAVRVPVDEIDRFLAERSA